MDTSLEDEIDFIISRLTLEQKIALCSGADFWHTKAFPEAGLPSVMMCDGPHGLRKQDESADMLGINDSVPATCFPTASLSSCSFDEELLEAMGAAIGTEARAQGVSMVLGPGANIQRSPLCGRNFEYFSEEPYLTGKMAAAHIRGLESTGVAACVKHFALNNQEYKRFNSDSLADERTKREVYLAGFERAIKEGHPSCVMSSYNKIDGSHASCNKELLTDILREEWGFDGMVVTDWGALSDRTKAFEAGCDLCMPGGSAYGEAQAALDVREGKLSECDVDASARRIIEFVFRHEAVQPEHDHELMKRNHDLARIIAERSIVLLKNDSDLLPLDIDDASNILFVGDMAKTGRFQGAGSSHINPWKLSQVIDFCPDVRYVQGCQADGSETLEGLAEVYEQAALAKVVVVFAGLPEAYESEGFDRKDMDLPPGHLAMIRAAMQANENVVVVLMCGSPVEVPWADDVSSVVFAGLSGEAGGEAIARVLFGEVNPSGKLAETWPEKLQDCVCAPYWGTKVSEYREGIYVGYRYYQRAGVIPRYPFGHGLSYTTFEYDDLHVSREDEDSHVSFVVKNTGANAGDEVAQVYVGKKEFEGYRPVRELAGFKKVFLKPGESQTIDVAIENRSFQVWQDGWTIDGGVYRIEVGSSSSDIRLSGDLIIEGDSAVFDVPEWYSNPHGTPSHEDFVQLYGKPIANEEPLKGSFTLDNTLAEMAPYSAVARVLVRSMKTAFKAMFHGQTEETSPELAMYISSSTDCTLSALKINSGMSNDLLENVLDMANGKAPRSIKGAIGKVVRTITRGRLQ